MMGTATTDKPVTSLEVSCTKNLLEQYDNMKIMVEDFEENDSDLVQVLREGRKGELVDVIAKRQLEVYDRYHRIISLIDRAHNAIGNRDTQKMIEIRYVQGYSHIKTALYFSGKYSDRTVTRRIKKGIESIAKSLRDWGLFEAYKDLLEQSNS
ncbi:hypothetical protein [Paenibacillus glucanolyticus]|uniref:hypothetical protein n=1 Tax=Paenibacillus glucanolyticus TaxID=59843 RepID=UPI00128B34BA|nr:hypothetical protein [Paenibacillus glucanolyticus]MPY15816.1 hypothetical protein [Paenibacillus glucanolyticus]